MLASISIKRHWVVLASLSLLLVVAVACGSASGGGAAAVSGGDAATAAPAATAVATSAPAIASDDVVPSGEATVAVASVRAGVGTPRFCTAGCSEDIYIAGIMETLFRPNYKDALGEKQFWTCFRGGVGSRVERMTAEEEMFEEEAVTTEV